MPSTISINTISNIVHATWLQHFSHSEIEHLCIDSRAVAQIQGCLFIALIGKRNDAHRYLEFMYQKGIRNFIVQKAIDVTHFPEANILLVKDALSALQAIVANHRLEFSIPIIGITGSNGKTIVKEWLHQLLQPNYTICRSPKSFNSQVGVPLSVWLLKEEHNLGIFEAGISETNEMQALENIIKPSIGVFTNYGNAHSEGFESMEQKVHEKFQLFKHTKCLIYCKDYPLIHQEITDFNKEHIQEKKIKPFCWSTKSNADLIISKKIIQDNATIIQAIYNNEFIEIAIPFIDAASIENAIHCWCVMLYLGIEQGVIQERMKGLSPIEMRLELKQANNNCILINDSYNSDFNSLAIAIDFLKAQPAKKHSIIISDILQSGMVESHLYTQISELLRTKGVERVVAIGKAISDNKQVFDPKVTFYETTDDFVKDFGLMHFEDEAILLKGSRAFAFEKISNLLQQKSHETILEINLGALINNYRFYKSKLKPTVKVMAMVKAFSYGSGSYEVANVLQYNRVDYLAVAYTDEGVELRNRGINVPIMVMNPTIDSFDKMLEYQLEPEIYNMRLLQSISAWAKQKLLFQKQINIHLKLDTGMHRLGFFEYEIPDALRIIMINGCLHVKSVFTHLVASDTAEHDDFTNQQVRVFDAVSKTLEETLGYSCIKHVLNSGGITRFENAHYDMVRLGIGLYGISNNPSEFQFLENVCNLKTAISQIKTLDIGDTVGYNRKGIIDKQTRIATLPIGYADGFARRLGNGNYAVLINNKYAPTIGNICMDMCMVDITSIDCVEGDSAIIFGIDIPIKEYAKALDTISYEALTNVSERVKRIYIEN